MPDVATFGDRHGYTLVSGSSPHRTWSAWKAVLSVLVLGLTTAFVTDQVRRDLAGASPTTRAASSTAELRRRGWLDAIGAQERGSSTAGLAAAAGADPAEVLLLSNSEENVSTSPDLGGLAPSTEDNATVAVANGTSEPESNSENASGAAVSGPGGEPVDAVPTRLRPVSIDSWVGDAFPSGLDHWFKHWVPSFRGASLSDTFQCSDPHPSVYFNNAKEASWALFHNEAVDFPMATDYLNSSEWAPPVGSRQAVLGFAEMQGPYYRYLAEDLDTDWPYLVVSINAYNYTEALNYQFVECALLGWPGFDQFISSFYPLRVVLKNAHHGDHCEGGDTGHAWCNLETSWGLDPEHNSWRNTVKEMTALYQLCAFKYRCDIRKVLPEPSNDTSSSDGEVPQVWLFRVLSEDLQDTMTAGCSNASNETEIVIGPEHIPPLRVPCPGEKRFDCGGAAAPVRWSSQNRTGSYEWSAEKALWCCEHEHRCATTTSTTSARAPAKSTREPAKDAARGARPTPMPSPSPWASLRGWWRQAGSAPGWAELLALGSRPGAKEALCFLVGSLLLVPLFVYLRCWDRRPLPVPRSLSADAILSYAGLQERTPEQRQPSIPRDAREGRTASRRASPPAAQQQAEPHADAPQRFPAPPPPRWAPPAGLAETTPPSEASTPSLQGSSRASRGSRVSAIQAALGGLRGRASKAILPRSGPARGAAADESLGGSHFGRDALGSRLDRGVG